MGIRTYLQKDFDPESLSETLASLKHPIVGVDEVGRGCLAGPVYAAAVCFKSIDGADPVLPKGMTDSKLLSEKRRLEYSEFLKTHHHFGIGFATVEEVDELNILQASFLAMTRALKELEKGMNCKCSVVLVDGHMKIRDYRGDQIPVVKGDLRVAQIAAASIIAKVTRDEMMKGLDQDFPEFGFGKHKGYGSAHHRKVIADQGPTIWHRRSFSGVKEHC